MILWIEAHVRDRSLCSAREVAPHAQPGQARVAHLFAVSAGAHLPLHHWRSRCQIAIQALQVVLKMSTSLHAVVQRTGQWLKHAAQAGEGFNPYLA